MKTKLFLYLAFLCLSAQGLAAQGTSFTYQGRLTDNGSPANGAYDLEFRVFDLASGGNQRGNTITANDITITNGLFTVIVDPGAGVFDGAARWLNIAMRPGASSGAFTNLLPRQDITPTPYAILAENISGTVGSSGLSGTYANAVTFNNAANGFTGNGSGLTALNASQLTSGAVPTAALSNAWKISGNSGTTPGTHFLGTTDSQALELKVNNDRALRMEPRQSGIVNLIGGSSSNFVATGRRGATIAGGGSGNTFFFGPHSISADFATIGGGFFNTIESNAADSTIAGGNANSVRSGGLASTISGGTGNVIGTNAAASTIGGGMQNIIRSNALHATIGGGYANSIQANASDSTIGGGVNNVVASGAFEATIGGGYINEIQTNANDSVIGGGFANIIQAYSYYSTLGGGNNNVIQNSAEHSTIGGGVENTIFTLASASTIAGGVLNRIRPDAFESAIAGGRNNTIDSMAHNSAIGGGENNTIATNASYGTISGGSGNFIKATASYSAIGGGDANTIGIGSIFCTIGGGIGNVIRTNALKATIGGGALNSIYEELSSATIGGGFSNAIRYEASSATIAGGSGNTIQTDADGATIGGGVQNTSAGNYAVVPGGYGNVAGAYSFAAGRRAKATHAGAFVWADSTDADFGTSANNQFLLRANGGVGLGSTNPAGALHILGPTGTPPAGLDPANNGLVLGLQGTAGYKWIQTYGGPLVLNSQGNNVGIGTTNPQSALHVVGTVTATAFNPPSDRNLKENFAAISPREVLDKVAALAITRWNFKGDAGTPHLGPMAQEFHAAFGLGTDNKHIATVDADGVALAAIQGLKQKMEQDNAALRSELKSKDAEIQDLKVRLSALEKLLTNFNTKGN